jgi:hypothetical protein
MERVMHVRFVTIAAAVTALASSAAAEPAKTSASQPEAPAQQPRPVVLASADHVANPAPAPEASPAAGKPHRAARVTTCRCGGDPQPQQEQP